MVQTVVAQLFSGILLRDAAELTPAFALNRKNGAEPLDIAKLAMAMEAHWGFTMHDDRVAEWRTLGDAMAYATELLEDGQGGPVQRSDEDRTAWFYE